MAGVVMFCGLLMSSQRAYGFSFLFAKDNGVDIVTHAKGYSGDESQLYVTVGIDPTSSFADELLVPTLNTIRTWNAQAPVMDNRQNCACMSSEQFDIESILLHEMGHAIGFDHPNLGVEAGVPSGARGLAMSTFGADGVFDFVDETAPEFIGIKDGVGGSSDDIRGDDVNLNYFHIDTNNPFVIDSVVDATTYSRDLADLPSGDVYSAVGSGEVGVLNGVTSSQAVMHQVFSPGVAQRDLSFDDVAGLRFAQSGLDHLAETGDDYNLTLIFTGVDADADIVIDYGGLAPGSNVLANTVTEGNFIPGTSEGQVAIRSAEIQLSDTTNWYFNTLSNAATPTAVFGDLDGDFAVGLNDVELLSNAIISGSPDLLFDLTGDGWIDQRDTYQLVRGTINPLAADFNLDGQVDVQDLSLWATGFGGNGGFNSGDANLDGQVDVQDLSLWATGFGETGGNTSGLVGGLVAEASAVAIPEPSSLMLVWVGVALIGRRRA